MPFLLARSNSPSKVTWGSVQRRSSSCICSAVAPARREVLTQRAELAAVSAHADPLESLTSVFRRREPLLTRRELTYPLPSNTIR